jgi:hypothetical protein
MVASSSELIPDCDVSVLFGHVKNQTDISGNQTLSSCTLAHKFDFEFAKTELFKN